MRSARRGQEKRCFLARRCEGGGIRKGEANWLDKEAGLVGFLEGEKAAVTLCRYADFPKLIPSYGRDCFDVQRPVFGAGIPPYGVSQ